MMNSFEQQNKNKRSGRYKKPWYKKFWEAFKKFITSRVGLLCIYLFLTACALYYFIYVYEKDVLLKDLVVQKETVVEAEIEEPEAITAIIEPYPPQDNAIKEEIKRINESIDKLRSDIKKRPTPRPSVPDKSLVREVKELKDIIARQSRKIEKLRKQPAKSQKTDYQYLIDTYFKNPVGALCVKFKSRSGKMDCWHGGVRNGARRVMCCPRGFVRMDPRKELSKY